MTRTAINLRSALDLVPADVLSYRRGPGAWDGPGWYLRPFGGQECKLHGTAADIIRAARTRPPAPPGALRPGPRPAPRYEAVMSPCWALSLFGSVVSTHRSEAAAEAQRERLLKTRAAWGHPLQINIYPCETPEEALAARREVARNRR